MMFTIFWDYVMQANVEGTALFQPRQRSILSFVDPQVAGEYCSALNHSELGQTRDFIIKET